MPRPEAARLLGLPEDAPAPEVQRAFLRAARRVHPDVLGDAPEEERRAAAHAFDRMLRARDVLLVPARRGSDGTPPQQPTAQSGPVFRQVPGRGLGGSLVVLALLAFLLVALVTVEQAVSGVGPAPLPPPPATSVAP